MRAEIEAIAASVQHPLPVVTVEAPVPLAQPHGAGTILVSQTNWEVITGFMHVLAASSSGESLSSKRFDG